MPSEEPAPPAARQPLQRWRSRRGRVALVALLLFAGLVIAFEWTWFRPLIQHHVHERSGRRVDFDALHIGLNHALQPTVRIRNLVVQNAPWAAPRPLVQAAVFDFTLAWESLRGDRVVVTRLTLADAELDLERQADGLRNWRLTWPEDRGPGRVRVMSVDARNTRARVIERGLGLELELQATPLAAPVVLPAHSELPLTKQLALRGTRDGMAFDAQLAVSEVLTLFDTAEPLALRGELRAGTSRANVEGTLTDLAQLARLDLELRVAGPRVADLGRVLGVRVPLPALPTAASAHLAKAGERWSVTTLQAKVGRSDLAGEAQFDRKTPGEGRSTLRAALTSERVNIADFRATPSSASGAAPLRAEATTANPFDADIDRSARSRG